MARLNGNFAAQLSAYADKVGRTVVHAYRSFAFSIFREVINRTPVKDGHMRGNWQTSSGTPKFDIIDRPDKKGTAAIADIMPNLDGTGHYFLSNNLPYAKRRKAEGGAPVVGATRTKFGVGVGGNFIEEIMRRREEIVRKESGIA